MKTTNRLLGVIVAIFLWACAPETPRYEAVAVVGYRKSITDEVFETAFLRSETFLRFVFDDLPSSDLREFKDSISEKIDSKTELFRRFVHQSYMRRGGKEGEIEVCFLDANPSVAASMANHIVDMYVEGRSEQAHLVRRAKAPERPVKQ